MRVVTGDARHGPVVSSAITLSAVALLGFTVATGYSLRVVAPTLALVVTLTVASRVMLAWRSLIALIILVILFIPIKRYTLPAGLPFNLEPYRLVVGLVAVGWATSLLIDPRVRLRQSPIDTPLTCLYLAVLGSLVVNTHRIEGLQAVVVKKVMFFASFFVLFYLVVSVVRRQRDIDFLVKVLAGGGAVVAVFALIESRTGYNVFNQLTRVVPFLHVADVPEEVNRGARLRVYASAQHPIALGAAFVMLVPLGVYLARSTKNRLWWLVVGLLALGALSTVSRTAVVMLIVGIIVYVWLRPREMKRLWPALVPALLLIHIALPGTLGSLKQSFLPKGGLIAEQQDQRVGSGRLATLGPSLHREFVPNPILGEGFGTRITRPEPNLTVNAPITDDQWLGVLLETGLAGFLSLVWLFTRFVRRLASEAKIDRSSRGMLLVSITASIAAFAIGMLTYDTFSFIQVMFLAFVLLGLGAAVLRSPRGEAVVES